MALDINTRKQNMINYLLDNLDEDEFDRGIQEYGDEQALGFDNYQQFVDYQKAAVNQADEYQLQTLEFLRDKIVPRSELVDKESVSGFQASGMVFDYEGNFVFLNER